MELSNLTPNEILDRVLSACKPDTEYKGYNPIAIDSRLLRAGTKISSTKLHEALYKLVKDEYVRFEEQETFMTNQKIIVKYYMMTFEGEVFMSNGGYVEESKVLDAARHRDEILENQSLSNANRLNYLTFWLAVGSIVLALIEIVKTIHQWDSPR